MKAKNPQSPKCNKIQQTALRPSPAFSFFFWPNPSPSPPLQGLSPPTVDNLGEGGYNSAMEKPTAEMLEANMECYGDLTDEQKELVGRSAVLLQIGKGKTIITSASPAGQAVPCYGVLFVTKGRLRTFLISDDGREVDLFYVDPGEVSVLTASCLIRAITFEVHVTAEEDTEAVLVPISTFQKIQKENLRIENFILKAAAERFSDVMWTLQQMLFLPVQKRIAIYLHDECVRTGGDQIQTTHRQIAQALGTAREVVTRILRIMQEKHIISVSRGAVTVLDRKALLRETR